MDTFFIFEVNNLLDYTAFIDPYTLNQISDPFKYIKIGVEYKVVDFASSSYSKFYNKYIPYYMAAPIIQVDENKLIMLYYEIEDFYKDDLIISTNDENGIVELEEFPTKRVWLDVVHKNLSQSRNSSINEILELQDLIEEKNIESIFNGDFSVFDDEL